MKTLLLFREISIIGIMAGMLLTLLVVVAELDKLHTMECIHSVYYTVHIVTIL